VDERQRQLGAAASGRRAPAQEERTGEAGLAAAARDQLTLLHTHSFTAHFINPRRPLKLIIH